MKHLDLRVYVITSAVAQLGRSHEDVARAAIEGGATVIQFRDKTMDSGQFTETTERLVALSRTAEVPLIINDRVDVAISMGAGGIHIGRNDGDVSAVRKSLRAGMVLGVSATDYAEAVSLDGGEADYLGVGPVFPTGSKDDATPPIGLDELARICRSVKKPVVAIGGINEENLRRVIEAGAAGAAVVSAVTHATDMTAAVGRLKRIWEEGS